MGIYEALGMVRALGYESTSPPISGAKKQVLMAPNKSERKPCGISMLESDRNGSMREGIALFHFFPFLLFPSLSPSFRKLEAVKRKERGRRQRREQRVPPCRLRTLKGGEFHSIALIAAASGCITIRAWCR